MTKTPPQIAESMCESGCKKAKLSLSKMLVLGILAGVYIGFGAQLMVTVTQDTARIVGTGITQFLGGVAFSVGLMLVVIGGAELFTGNNLMSIPCCKRAIGVQDLLRNWGVIYFANFLGSILLALLVFATGVHAMNGGALGTRIMSIANAKVSLSFTEALARGILCNWLVCLAVWLAASSKNTIGKIFGIFFPIMAFVAMGFEHSVANMYFIPAGMLHATLPQYAAGPNLTWGGFFINNLLPVTIGNIIGGAFFVGTLYWFVYLRR